MFDALFRHPFVTYTFVISNIIALVLVIAKKISRTTLNPKLYSLPILLPIILYILNYGIIQKTCGLNNSYIGILENLPSFHIFCAINSYLSSYISVLSIIWLLVAGLYIVWNWIKMDLSLWGISKDVYYDKDIYLELNRIGRSLNISMPKLLVVNTRLMTIFVTGVINKSVIISKGALDVLNKDELVAGLAHELSHIKISGALLRKVLAAGRIMLLFSPATLWAYKEYINGEEIRCDALASSQIDSKANLASAILKLSKPRVSKFAKERIELILKNESYVAKPISHSLWILIVTVILASIFMC